MRRLTFHAKAEIALVATLLLASGDPNFDERIEVADVNARNALYKIEQLDSRVSEIESRLNM